VLFAQPLGGRKSGAGAEIPGREQRFEYSRKHVCRNPGTIVDHVNMSLFAGRARPDSDHAPGLRTANGLTGVLDKVNEHAAKTVIVNQDFGAPIYRARA
jgi:hypothetical protein